MHAAAAPQVPVELHVCTPSIMVEHCVAPGVHTPVHAPLAHAWLTHGTEVPHVPVAPHVWTASPEHCDAPGLQATHAPPRQTVAAPLQARAAPHCPVALHVSTPPAPPSSAPPAPPSSASPEHCVTPGVQTPAHAPPVQTYVHGDGAPQAPPEHVSTPLPEHWVAPAVHDPAHVPMLQTAGQAVPMFCQVPVMSQTCGCCPSHCMAPGVHVPEHVPPLHT